MSQIDYRALLTNSTFPMLSEQLGPTVIVSSNRSTNVTENKDLPHIYYCHNVMPTERGVTSIGYSTVISAASPAVTDFAEVRTIYGDERTRLWLAWTFTMEVYVRRAGTSFWLKVPDTSPSTVGPDFNSNHITTGRVNGITYIWYRGIGCFTYNEASDTLVNVTLTGLTILEVLGITASSGYLIAYTETDVAWSSTIDPTDFVPSAVTGAGGGAVADIGGDIQFAIPSNLGILIYSATNVVSMSFTGTVRSPFKYREVKNSKGGVSLDLVAHEANTENQYAYTTAGLQAMTVQKASTILPEVTDFLAGRRYETVDEESYKFTTYYIPYTYGRILRKKLTLIGSRYLVISYGDTKFEYALVYDIVLDRLGKLKITHVDCFEYIDDQYEVAKESIAFVDNTGKTQVVYFPNDYSSVVSNGLVILGKFQYTRGRNLHLLGLELENIQSTDDVVVATLAAKDGKNFVKVDGNELYSAEGIRTYGFNTSAKNHSILIKGRFDLVSATLIFKNGGHR